MALICSRWLTRRERGGGGDAGDDRGCINVHGCAHGCKSNGRGWEERSLIFSYQLEWWQNGGVDLESSESEAGETRVYEQRCKRENNEMQGDKNRSQLFLPTVAQLMMGCRVAIAQRSARSIDFIRWSGAGRSCPRSNGLPCKS